MKYYFFSYWHARHDGSGEVVQCVTNCKQGHPYSQVHAWNLSATSGQSYALISFQPITEEEYNEFYNLDE